MLSSALKELFTIKYRKPKTKVIATSNQKNPVVSFAPNWLRGWCGFSEPIIERERGTYEVLGSF